MTNTRLRGGLLLALTALTTGAAFFGPRARANTKVILPQFLRDVAPILDKKGCSVAACHGKFGGRGGLQLSLLTLTPADDFEPLVRGGRGRRVNLMEPEKSMLLMKATNKTPHAGGERFSQSSPEYRTIRDWIASGAHFDEATDATLTKLTLTPAQVTLTKVGQKVPMKVVASFSDGTTSDVTARANYETSDPAVVSVDEKGVMTGKRWGGAAVVVRYLGTVHAVSLTLPREDKTPYPKLTSANLVDDFVYANLKRLNVQPSRSTNDSEFLRRISLDLRGILPSAEEYDAFLTNKAPDKRAKAIDTFLDSPEFVDMRVLRLGDMLRIHPRNLGNNISGERSAALFTEWLKDAVAQNVPYDQFVKQLLVARGSSYTNGPTNFYRIDRNPDERMETTAQAFLGQRMACARCHKHPFDRWTTDDYWNFAAFMGRVGTRNGNLDGESEIYYNAGGRVTNQSVTGKNRGKEAPPTLLGTGAPMDTESLRPSRRTQESGPDLVAVLADWVTNRENPYFAKATVNRIWSHYLGRGIVHPVDDMRTTTPASVPGLLEALAKDFIGHQYDTKHLIRTIMNSRTYQTASEVNATNTLDNQFFSHFYPRPMLGQVLLDNLNLATGSTERFGDFPTETRATQLSLPSNSFFMDCFGRSQREFLAELEPKNEPTLVQVLHVLNSPYVDQKIRAGSGTVATLVRDKALSNEEIIKKLYLRTLSRLPSPTELAAAVKHLTSSPKRDEAVQDLMWALISSREFYFVS
jgi:Protein of unknown function (DUF1549)/Protein of unknown function (DUF1553)